jgi:hypothetical protein
MKILEKFIGVVVILLLIGYVFTGIDDARQKPYTQTAPLVVTASSNTADVALVKPLFNDDLTSVTAITSSNSTDSPAVTDYNPAGDTLTVSGLTANSTRTLSIAYTYARLAGAQDTLFSILPFLIVIGVLFVVGMSWWASRRG